MFNVLFAIVELIGVIGIVHACTRLHLYSLHHKWLRHTSQVGAWTVALLYGGAVMLIFYLAHLASSSIYLLVFGLSGAGTLVSGTLFFFLAVVVFHVIFGGLWIIPFLARVLADFSPKDE